MEHHALQAVQRQLGVAPLAAQDQMLGEIFGLAVQALVADGIGRTVVTGELFVVREVAFIIIAEKENENGRTVLYPVTCIYM